MTPFDFDMRWNPVSAIAAPLRRRIPTRYALSPRVDVFGSATTDEQIDRIFAVMALSPLHSFIVTTQSKDRMLAWFSAFEAEEFALNSDSSRITRAVNAVLRLGFTWAKCGSTNTFITTTGRNNLGREPGMLRRHDDGGVSRLCFGDAGEEIWCRCSDDYQLRVPFNCALAEGMEPGFSLKVWPLPNVTLEVAE